MMLMKRKKSSLLVWICCAILIVVQLVEFGYNYSTSTTVNTSIDVVGDFLFLLFALMCAVIGSLIISRQPRNTIGWLLVVYPFGFSLLFPFQLILPLPGADLSQISTLSLLAVWVTGWDWWLVLGPVLLIPLLFPSGRLLSPRWRWAIAGLIFEFAIFIYLATFVSTFNVSDSATLQNPIGWLPEETVNLLLIPFQVVLVAIGAFCVAAIIVRYRRAVGIEREQIKWLFYVFGIFVALLLVGLFFSDEKWYGILLDISFLTIPLAIGVSILRYRLWDIDILIRRTISYAILTITLGLSYLGSVILLQGIFNRMFAGSSQVVIVFSTLLIAALFTPLRRRIQAAIDRRFYRQKYDAAQALAEFSAAARQEVKLERISGSLVGLVEQTIQPEAIWLWIREDKNK